MNAELAHFRLEIDALDRELLDLLVRRFEVIDSVARLKAARGIPARIQSRITTVIQRREALGRARGLPRRAAAHIWEVIVEESCRQEELLIEQIHRDNKL